LAGESIAAVETAFGIDLPDTGGIIESPEQLVVSLDSQFEGVSTDDLIDLAEKWNIRSDNLDWRPN
jgi:hypothetical protein